MIDEETFELLEAQNEDIKKLLSVCQSKDVIINSQENEIARLKENIEDVLKRQSLLIEKQDKYSKAEAIREFAKKIKAQFLLPHLYGKDTIYKQIDVLVNEMVDEKGLAPTYKGKTTKEEEILDKIKKYRFVYGLTVKETAKRIGYSERNVYRMLNKIKTKMEVIKHDGKNKRIS